jgi:S-DNA-T family DNA segregation ATPase FtsK/SpoIIIE
LIMATQHPSSDVVTSTIKASLPARIAFRVMNHHASRTVIGEAGAEQLLGNGDMLFAPGAAEPLRVHGCYVADEECHAVAGHWRSQGTPDYISAVTEEPGDRSFALDGQSADDVDPDAALYRKACQIVAESQKASTSYVQRQLRIGYNSAARLVERMEREGRVGAPDHLGRRGVKADGQWMSSVAATGAELSPTDAVVDTGRERGSKGLLVGGFLALAALIAAALFTYF